MAPVEVLRQLTALQRLRLTASVGQPSDPSGFSMLGQLTYLELSSSAPVCSSAAKFKGCSGLRALHLDLSGVSCLPALRSTLLERVGCRDSLHVAIPTDTG